MKILLIVLAFFLISQDSSAQFKRGNRGNQLDSSMNASGTGMQRNRQDQMEMIKELNLTKVQKIKLRELHQSMQATKTAIENDPSLTAQQKQGKLKEARMDQLQKINAILTPEQQEQFRQKMMGNGRK